MSPFEELLDEDRATQSKLNTYLSVRNVGRWFGDDILFRHVSAEITGGTSCLIAGPNGSGKSTLMRILAGVLRSSEGEVKLTCKGESILKEQRPLHCMVVAPYLGLYRGLSARENLEFALTQDADRISESDVEGVLKRVGIWKAADRLVAHFSSGMVQRLRLAIAMLRDSEVCLLDEPWMNLDEEGRELVMGVIRKMKATDKIVVVASNDPHLKNHGFDQQINLLDYS